MKGGSLLFWYRDRPVSDDPEVRACWQRAAQHSGDREETLCLVTGQRDATARLHPNIKGVAGAQSSGAALVSFNAPAFCSYDHEQGDNAPTGEYAAFAYTTALNALLADRERTRRVGDTTIVCWASGGKTAYQDFVMASLYDDDLGEQDILNAVRRLADGEPVEWDDERLDPDTRFYVLGLAPNAARLSVRFFWQNTFGCLAAHVARHYEQLEIVRPAYDKFPHLPVWRLLRETVNANARNPEPNPRLAGDLLLAILNGGPYPATLLDGVVLRIRAERDITPRPRGDSESMVSAQLAE